MKIALVGYGKMGREIHALAIKQGIEISQTLTCINQIKQATFSSAEIAIEFTQPDAAIQNLPLLFAKNVPVVCGTTGWLEHLPKIKQSLDAHNGTLLYASNFSIGVHLFWQSLAHAADVFSKAPIFKVSGEETHHIHKKDKPSGTAVTCQQILQQRMQSERPINFTSHRKGQVLGQHRIFFDSPYDHIEISHTATSREGFASGALACAQWLSDKKGLLTIDDYLKDVL